MKKAFAILLTITLFIACKNNSTSKNSDEAQNSSSKTAVLIVNHGSHDKKWRDMLVEVETNVKEDLLANQKIDEVRTAFMEYNEPSIATRLKEFDEEGFEQVIIVPLFLTVSSHYSHDIPVIAGLSADPKAIEELKKEKIETYKAKARITITPPLDYTTILKKNIARRVKNLSEDSSNEGVLLVAYGDAMYNQQWEEMVEEIGKYLNVKTGHEDIAYSWCGHLVNYSTEPTKNGIKKLMELNDNVIVIPVLVANDEYFQDEIIQTAVNEVKNGDNVKYIQDAILPDTNIENWVKDISVKTVENL